LAAGTYTIVQQASGNVSSNGTFSVSGTAIGSGNGGFIQVTNRNVNLVVAPLQLRITSVNGGANPTAGTGFSVVVQAQGAGGMPFNVLTNTTVTLSRATGSGTLGGTLTGTILAGNSPVTISGVTYTKAESGVVLTATRTTGDTLAAGNSSPFTVNPGTPAALALTSGNNQSALASSPLAIPFVVTVTDANANPASGASVTFAVATVPGGATGQSLSTISAITGTNGQASTILTLGNVIGGYTVTATSGTLSGSPVTFTAAATAGLAITSVNGGANPTAGAGFSVVVEARGAGGTPANVSTNTDVLLSRTAGSGTLGGTLTGTILAGTNSVTISGVTYTKAESGVILTATRTAGNPVTPGTSAPFTVSPGAAAILALTSGNNQSGLASSALAIPFVVTVTDANTNPVSGASVTFAMATAPSGATGQSLSAINATTGTNGQVSTILTLGNAIGTYTVTATSGTLNGSPLTFNATATANLAITSVNGGLNPTAGTGFSVVVQAQGAGGTPINLPTDTDVLLSRATGSGTLGGTLTGTILAGNNSVTISGVTYTKAESGVILTATRTNGAPLTPGNSAPFTVNAGAAAALVLSSGNNQSALVGAALASPLVVTVTDANGNPVSGTSVTFALAAVPGGATGQSLSTTNAATGINGQASTILTLGNAIGTYTVTAASGTLSGSPVSFTATATANLAITSVNGGANPIAGTGFSVLVQVQGGGGTPINVFTNTDVLLSRAAGSGILGGTLTGTILAGNNSVTISGVTYTKAESGVVLTVTRTSGAPMTPGNSAPFTVNPGAAATLALTSGNNQNGFRQTLLSSPLVVMVTDSFGNPVSGTSVTFAIATVPAGATGQSLSTTSTATAANGQASTIVTLGSAAGTYTVTATSGTLNGSPMTFTATAVSGNYAVVAAATYEYQICFKCHSGYSWLPGSPPTGLSANGSAINPVQTDVAQEFSPNNLSGHPVVTGLTNYPNSKAPKALGAGRLKAPWNVNVGTQTMTCSDCHNTDAATPAAQGPHGSASPFMLRVFSGGPAPSTWPTATSFNSSWCANCHNDLAISMDGHANHHSAGGCNVCHVVIPHGSKMSRLMADQDGTMPARYALNSTISTTTVKLTSFTKSTGGNYGESACRVNCGHHSSGSSGTMENW
jgi:hypothetical protein